LAQAVLGQLQMQQTLMVMVTMETILPSDPGRLLVVVVVGLVVLHITNLIMLVLAVLAEVLVDRNKEQTLTVMGV
jgi:hypothetical protein